MRGLLLMQWPLVVKAAENYESLYNPNADGSELMEALGDGMMNLPQLPPGMAEMDLSKMTQEDLTKLMGDAMMNLPPGMTQEDLTNLMAGMNFGTTSHEDGTHEDFSPSYMPSDGGSEFQAEMCSVGGANPVHCENKMDKCTNVETQMDCKEGDAKCVCTTTEGSGEDFHAEGCTMSKACSIPGDRCVQVKTPEADCVTETRGECVCVAPSTEESQVEGCMNNEGPNADCRQGDSCISARTGEAVMKCPEGDKCFCAGRKEGHTGGHGGKGNYEQCMSRAECSDGSPCVNMDTMQEEESCTGSGCFCIPCFMGSWHRDGCMRFETIYSSCRGALLLNVSEACDGDPCKVSLPEWESTFSQNCEVYCTGHNLTCGGSWMAFPEDDESVCTTKNTEVRSCFEPIQKNIVCECKGMTMERRYRAGPDHDTVDHCMNLLDTYEKCVQGKPDLWEGHMPDQRIRRALERERNQKCIDIPQDVFDKYNVVGCQSKTRRWGESEGPRER